MAKRKSAEAAEQSRALFAQRQRDERQVLIVEHSVDGVFIYRESMAAYSETERLGQRLLLTDLDVECFVSVGSYVAVEFYGDAPLTSRQKSFDPISMGM